MDDRFDGLYLNLAQQCQGIDNLLDSLFSFLRRKTDFYTAPRDTLENKVLEVIRRQSALAEQDKIKREKAKEEEELVRAAKREAAAKKRKEHEEKKQKLENPTPAGGDGAVEAGTDGTFDLSTEAGEQAVSTKPPAFEGGKIIQGTGEGGEEEEEEEAEEDKEDNTAPPGNGGSTDRYTWVQTLGELSVNVPVPEGTKARDVVCTITKKKLKVGIRGMDPIIDGELHKSVKVDDSVWTLEDGKEVVVALQKDNQMEWWKCVIVGDVEIDTSKVQPENSKLADLDGETRQTVEKMMFDQRQKAQGLPTADEMQKQELLKKFMDQHPEMDFSKAKIS